MNISKTMFKNLIRCPNFASLYDLYLFRNYHHLKTINGVDINITKGLVEDLEDAIFDDENEEIMEIFSHMYDEETGDDLTLITNSQMEAFSHYFTKVEELAGDYIASRFRGNHQYDVDTRKQKKYSFTDGEHYYYCYLDIYSEGEDGKFRVFEVKSTTSSKFFKLGRDRKNKAKVKSERYESIFVKGNDGIVRLREDYSNDVSSPLLDGESYNKQRSKLFERYSSDGTGKYVYDLAVQRYIIEKSLIQNNLQNAIDKFEYYLVVLNGDYLFDGTYIDDEPVYHRDINNQDLFTIFDLTTITKEMQEKIANEKETIEQYIDQKALTNTCFGKHCERAKSTQCKFKPVCFEPIEKSGSILEYIMKHYAFKDESGYIDVFDLINKGKYKIDDVPYNLLSKKVNRIQYDCYQNNEVYIDLYKIKLALNELKYPLYHLDFETFGCPLPRFYGESPYSQSLFQYSLHVEKEKGVCDKTADHFEFLAPDHEDCRRELIEKLIEDIDLSNGGTVIVYNESFEKTRLKEMAELYTDLAIPIMNIHDHIFDLLYVLKGNKTLFAPLLPLDMPKADLEERAKMINYYHNKLHGSFSIKKVLPIFSPLTYNDLVVKNGTEAVLAYGLLPTYTNEEYKRIYLALRKYCQQDTWAMVEILNGLWKMIN